MLTIMGTPGIDRLSFLVAPTLLRASECVRMDHLGARRHFGTAVSHASVPDPTVATGLSCYFIMAGSSSTGTATKRRKVSGTNIDRGFMNILTDITDADLKFVMEHLRGRPELTAKLASLCRDGRLDDALAKFSAGADPKELGRKLPPKCKRFRNLPPRFWAAFWQKLGILPEDEDQKIDKDALEPLYRFALCCGPATPLPTKHKASEYEGPLMACLGQRYKDVGSRLAGIPAARFATIGYFLYLGCDVLHVATWDRRQIKLNLTMEQINNASDWAIDQNHTPQAALVSKSAGHSVDLFHLARAQLSIERPEDEEEFEYPAIADNFPDPKLAKGKSDNRSAPAASLALADSSTPIKQASDPSAQLAIANAQLALPGLDTIVMPS